MPNALFDTFLGDIPFDREDPDTAARRVARRLSCLTPHGKFKFLMAANDNVIDALDEEWIFKARPDQLPPDSDDWLIWLLLGGRGSGKTRAGAEWVTQRVQDGAQSIALVGPSYNEVREVMIEGESGLMQVDPEDNRPVYLSSRRRLEWPSGAVGHVFSAEDPNGLRGSNFDTAWGDEFCAWEHADDTLANLRLAMRKSGPLGLPRTVLTTTPKPIPALTTLMTTSRLATSRSRTLDNADNLAPGFVTAMIETYGGTRRGRQELDGDLLTDHTGALWTRKTLEIAARPTGFTRPDFEQVVVAIDPPVSAGQNANACGIIVAASVRPTPDKGPHVVVLHDGTLQGVSPTDWAKQAMWLAAFYEATRIVAEVNQGGDLVETVLRNAGENIPIKKVRAKTSKYNRAQMVAHHYETRRIHHSASFPELEDELCLMGAVDDTGKPLSRASPDRADALVWAILDLLPRRTFRRPRIRRL